MKYLTLPVVLAGLLFSISSALAQSDDTSDRPTQRISISYHPGFNITAGFRGLGGFQSSGDPGPAIGDVNRTYGDGFVKVDSSTNAGGLTTFWGYDNASQINGTSSVTMHSTNSSPDADSLGRGGDPQNGIELTYNYEIGRAPWRGWWGFEGAFSYTALSIRDSSPLNGTMTVTSDKYALNGLTAPPPGFTGSFSGPNAAIGDAPERSTATSATLITGQRNLGADVFGFRLGPYWQLPLSEKFSLSLSAGLALAEVHSEFSLQETVTAAGVGMSSFSGRSQRDGLLAGGYVEGSLSYSFTRSWALFTGVQFQDVGTFTQNLGPTQATLDFRNSIFLTAGVSYSF